MFSIGLSMKLRPGCYDDYKKAHDEVWPELLDNMRRHQVQMVIYRLDDRLFLYATAPDEQQWLATRDGARVDEWNEFMASCLETDADGNIIFEELELAFTLGAPGGAP